MNTGFQQPDKDQKHHPAGHLTGVCVLLASRSFSCNISTCAFSSVSCFFSAAICSTSTSRWASWRCRCCSITCKTFKNIWSTFHARSGCPLLDSYAISTVPVHLKFQRKVKCIQKPHLLGVTSALQCCQLGWGMLQCLFCTKLIEFFLVCSSHGLKLQSNKYQPPWTATHN